MSAYQQGPDWWQASDGKWYAPQGQMPPPPQQGYAPQQQYAPQPRKKPVYKRAWFWILIIIALGLAGCIGIVAMAGNAINTAANKQHTVVYRVTGPGHADITFATFSGGNSGTSQDSSASLPWSKTVTAKGFFSGFSLFVSNASGHTVTCSITVDGKVVSHNTGSGQFASASCYGST